MKQITEVERAAQLLIDYCESMDCMTCEFFDNKGGCNIEVPSGWIDNREKNSNDDQ